MDRPIRAAVRYRNGWRQIGLSDCIFLLPPVVVGAAIHSKLATRTDAEPSAPKQTISLSGPAAAGTVQPFNISQPSDTAAAATFPQAKKTFPQPLTSTTAAAGPAARQPPAPRTAFAAPSQSAPPPPARTA